MLSKRIIACLDVREGQLAKSVKFVDTRDIGDPVAKGQRNTMRTGSTSWCFYDITASSDKRDIMLRCGGGGGRTGLYPVLRGGWDPNR